jgi:RNA:NAD 2'-phosphotransferase (TPT1/KptA family)
MKKYDMIHPTESNHYCLFSRKFEDDPNILFHATKKENLAPISQNGFQSADNLGTGDLQSVSYAYKSSACLAHLNGSFEQDIVVFAVRFKNLQEHGIVSNQSDIHVYSDVQPEILRYCEIPQGFVYD